MDLLIYIAVVLGLLEFKLSWDWYAKNKQNRVIDHTTSAVLDGFYYFLTALWIFQDTIPVWKYAVIVGIGALIRWLLFDPLFNLLNGDKWDHCGDSSWMDKLADYLDGDPYNQRCNFYIIIKIVLIIIAYNLWIN